MDFSKHGLKEGIVHGVKVLGWVALSGAVLSLTEWINGLQISQDQYATVAGVAIANAILAGLNRWLSTRKPGQWSTSSTEESVTAK